MKIEDLHSKKEIESAKKIGEIARRLFNDSHLMTDAELTEDERESRVPLKTSDYGYYRMYKWVCRICKTESVAYPFSECYESAYQHCIESRHRDNKANPPTRIIGGVFPKERLYK